MKRIVVFALLAALLLTAGCTSSTGSPDTGDAKDMTGFSSTYIDGTAVSGDVLKGTRLTMVNVWATYCAPCLREMPDLERLSHEYGDDFRIIGIPVDAADRAGRTDAEVLGEVRSILSDTGVTYPQILPSASLFALFLNDVQFIPYTVFVDENGKTVGEEYIGGRSYEDWKATVDELLKRGAE